ELLLDVGGPVQVHLGDGDELKVLAGGQRADVGQGHAVGAEAGVAEGFAGGGAGVGAEDERGGEAGRGEALQRGPAADAGGVGHGWGPFWEGGEEVLATLRRSAFPIRALLRSVAKTDTLHGIIRHWNYGSSPATSRATVVQKPAAATTTRPTVSRLGQGCVTTVPEPGGGRATPGK